MPTAPGKIQFRTWEWRSDDAPSVQGFRMYDSKGRGVFVSYTEAHNLADRIVDYTEQHESKENN